MPQWRGNPTYKLIRKKSLPLLRPPISATLAPLHGPRSKNTPYAMKIYKITTKRSKTVSRALPHYWILPRVYENSSNSRMDSASLRNLILDTLHSAPQGVSCMTSRAEYSVISPGITTVIANLRARWRSWNERAPSQPHVPPLAAQEPVYPFQCFCAD